MAGGLELGGFFRSCQAKPFYDSMFPDCDLLDEGREREILERYKLPVLSEQISEMF